jgi:glycosyltransferase involved in cell wall biosynthesis
MNILVLPYIIPYPANDGGKICIFGFIEKLQNRVDYTVLLTTYSVEDEMNILLLKEKWKRVDIRTVKLFENAPPPSKPGIKEMAKSLVRRIRKSFSRKVEVEMTPESYDLFNDNFRINPFQYKSKKYISALVGLINEKDFDIIQVELTENLNLVNVLPGNIKKIFIEIESRYSVINDFIQTKTTVSPFENYILNSVKNIELSLLQKYDAIFSLSEKDSGRLKSLLPESNVFASPFSIDDNNLSSISFDNFSVKKIIFIGPEAHYPNLDAINWFIEEVFLKNDFGVKLFIIGNWTEKTKQHYSFNQNIVFTGYIEDVSGYMNHSISIVPVRLGGGGLRTKILLAMAQGSPILSTNLGVDGFDLKNNKDCLLADDAKEFANQLFYAINNSSEMGKIALNAQQLFIEKFSVESVANRRFDLYENILQTK